MEWAQFVQRNKAGCTTPNKNHLYSVNTQTHNEQTQHNNKSQKKIWQTQQNYKKELSLMNRMTGVPSPIIIQTVSLLVWFYGVGSCSVMLGEDEMDSFWSEANTLFKHKNKGWSWISIHKPVIPVSSLNSSLTDS